MIDKKVKGGEITAPAPQHVAKRGTVIDLMEALRQSMQKVPEKRAVGNLKVRKKA